MILKNIILIGTSLILHLVLAIHVFALDLQKPLNQENWPKTVEEAWEITQYNLNQVEMQLQNNSSAKAFIFSRNIVIGVRALQNFNRLTKHKGKLLKKIDLSKILVLSLRLVNALKDHKTMLAKQLIRQLKDKLNE